MGSSLPDNIPGVGDGSAVAKQNPRFDPSKHETFGSEEYYVWSRIDGHTPLRQVILMVGFPADKTTAILQTLRGCGAILLGNEPPSEAAGGGQSLSASMGPDDAPDEIEPGIDISPAEQREMYALLQKVEAGNRFALLSVPLDVDDRGLKRAYFRISKRFHPDRYYGKRLGHFAGKLSQVFEAVNKAFSELSDPRNRARHAAFVEGKILDDDSFQTPREHAAELFEKACAQEIGGNPQRALPLFAAALRANPLPRYYRRAAWCAVRAEELKSGLEYAKKAADLRPRDPSYVRVLAHAYRVAGRLREAEEALVGAAGLMTESDVLAGELANDLAAVRRLMAQGR